MTPFLITGLPRCRTTWFSVVATIPGVSHCEHEPSLRMRRVDDVLAYYSSRSEQYVGISDCHLSQVLPLILEAFPMRTLIVMRSIEDVVASLQKRQLRPEVIPMMMHGINAVIGHPDVRRIDYTDLQDTDAVTDILQWLMPGATIDPLWVKQHQKTVIEANHALNRDLAEKNNTVFTPIYYNALSSNFS